MFLIIIFKSSKDR